MTAVTAAVWASRPGLGGRVKNITRAERPSDDYYLAHDHGGHVDHHVLYFGTDAVALDHLKRADVLLLGNSRLMFAARPRVLDAFFAARGLRYYVLGFGFREADRFPLAVIEKFDLQAAAGDRQRRRVLPRQPVRLRARRDEGHALRGLAVPPGGRDGARVPQGDPPAGAELGGPVRTTGIRQAAASSSSTARARTAPGSCLPGTSAPSRSRGGTWRSPPSRLASRTRRGASRPACSGAARPWC